MKSYNEIKALFGIQENNNSYRFYTANLPEGKNPESIDLTWYFDADVTCIRWDEVYYVCTKGQGDTRYTTEILPASSSAPTVQQSNTISEAITKQ
jgi:hypothetical protein